MNTPSPCDTCQHCYTDPLQKNNPDNESECKKDVKDQHWGDENCPLFEVKN